jgi:hypothetical protein
MRRIMKTFALSLALSISLLSGGTSFWLVAQPNISEAHSHLLETTLKLWLFSTQKTLELCSKDETTVEHKKKGQR